MKTLSVSEAKMKLSALVEEVSSTDQETVITRNGRAVAVLISPAELESLRESRDVERDMGLMSEIRKGLAELKARKAKLYTLEELLG